VGKNGIAVGGGEAYREVKRRQRAEGTQRARDCSVGQQLGGRRALCAANDQRFRSRVLTEVGSSDGDDAARGGPEAGDEEHRGRT